MNIKDLPREMYSEYILVCKSLESSFNFVLVFFGFLYTVSYILASYNNYFYLLTSLCLINIFFSLFVYLKKLNHLKKLFMIDGGWSLLK